MRIICQGSPPANIKYQFNCQNCSTVFEAEQREGEMVYDQRDGNFVKFNCPVCGFEIRRSTQTSYQSLTMR